MIRPRFAEPRCMSQGASCLLYQIEAARPTLSDHYVAEPPMNEIITHPRTYYHLGSVLGVQRGDEPLYVSHVGAAVDDCHFPAYKVARAEHVGRETVPDGVDHLAL